MRLDEAKVISGAVDELAVTLVGRSSFITPKFIPEMLSTMSRPLGSGESSEYQSSWCALKSPRTKDESDRSLNRWFIGGL